MKETIDRRRVLIGISALMGGALSSVAAKSFDAADSFDASQGFKRFTAGQVALLRALVDTILPESDTPSATGAAVDLYIDHMVDTVLNEKERASFIGFLSEFADKYPSFPSLSADNQFQVLSAVDQKLWEETPFAAGYRLFKELTLVGYYTSESGASAELEYDPVPGPFQNVPISEYSRTWST